jgi:Acyl-CoA carboxylase epsilon subunit
MTSEPGEGPLFSVVSGRPAAEDLAALTAVLAARLAARQRALAAQAAARPARSAWLDRAALTRTPLRPGPGAWRRSGLPA